MQIPLAVLLSAMLVLTAGCQNVRQAALEPEPDWSTKRQSVLEPGDERANLNVPAQVKTAAAGEIRRTAIDLLRQAADSTNPLLRHHAIEALQPAQREVQEPVRLALADENRGVRFAAAMTVGRLQLKNMASLVEPLLDDPSDSVRAASIYALRRCGQRVDPTPLSEMIMSEDPEVRGNAAFILGELGDPSAIRMLRESVQKSYPRVSVARSRIVELQIAEAMVKLGETSQLEVIRAALFAPVEQAELTVLACQMCGTLTDTAYAATLADMATREGRDQEPIEVRIAAVQALAQIDPSRVPLQAALVHLNHERPEVRAQAALAVGWARDKATLPQLAELLRDSNAVVQVAAAGAIVRATSR